MGMIQTISGFLWGNIIVFILVLSLLVFVHEMGHYLIGRWSGIRIMAFSIGFGRELVGYTDKHGTRWKLSLIPLGGYVKFYGDQDASSKPDFEQIEALGDADRSTTFAGASLWKRAATVAAGPIANFILAIAIFTVLFSIYGKPVTDPIVGEVKADSAAAVAGVLPGDRLVSIDGKSIKTFDDVRRYVSVRPEMSIVVTVERSGSMLPLTMVPKRTELTDQFGNKMEVGIIGIVTSQDTANFRVETLSVGGAMKESVIQCWQIVTGTFDYLGNVVTGRMKADQLGGPIRVAEATGQMATLGLAAVLQLAAVLSVSIGLLNLMPVPVLDGGHLVFYAIEALRGKPVGPRTQDIAFRIGFAMIMSLMVFATWNDTIGRFLG